MKKMKKIIATLLVCICMFNSVMSVSAATPSTNDLFSKETSETIEIDGISYTFDYSVKNEIRTIFVTNNVTHITDKVSFDPKTSILCLNGQILADNIETIMKTNSISFRASGWQTISTESYRITWAQGTTVAVVAAAIAVYLGTLGTAGVIAAMGVGALGALAASSTGGTIYLTLRMFTAPFTAPLYEYEWSFTASTGDSYGPFYYIP